jgi:hypothetical protein
MLEAGTDEGELQICSVQCRDQEPEVNLLIKDHQQAQLPHVA